MNVIGIDQGTTGTLVGLMNESGAWAQQASKSHRQFYPQPGWVEQDPDELWHNLCDLVNQVIAQAGISAKEIAGVGLANQGESVMLWNRVTGQPLHKALIWQDTRTEAALVPLAADAAITNQVRIRTGLKVDSYFSASKIRWLLDHCAAEIPLEQIACGTLDTWMIWKLTEGQSFVTDVSTAARTLLFNIHTLQWDQWLLDLFGIPLGILPTIMESTGHFGEITSAEVDCKGVPIVASLVDQPAAMIGQGCLSAGQIKATYGTGCFINLNAGAAPVSSKHGLLTILTWQREGRATYGLEGGVFTAGATLNWLRDKTGFFEDARHID
jgi:glycerol kinase